MGVSIADYPDLFTSAIFDFGKNIVEDISMDLQEYVGYGILTGKGQLEKHNGKGPYIRRDVRLNGQGNASFSELYEAESLSNQNMMGQITAPYRYFKSGYVFDEREQEINTGDEPSTIYDLIKNKRQAAFCDQAALLEASLWNAPDSETSKQLWGLAYWIAYSATEGFNGTVANGNFTTVGGLNPTTYTKWRNWTGNYTNATATDLVRKMRTAYVKTDFKNPINQVPSVSGMERKLGLYTTYPIISKLEELQESRDDRLADLASKDGTLRFRGVPVQRVPQLEALWGESDESLTLTQEHPVFGIDWSTFKLVYSPKYWLRESNKINSQCHNVMDFWIDSKAQLFNVNRRRNFVLARGALFA